MVEYVSSAGWGVFASRIDDLRGKDGDIKIFGMDPEVDSIFHLLGFDMIMRSFSILTEAIDDFSERVKGGAVSMEELTPAGPGEKEEPERIIEFGSKDRVLGEGESTVLYLSGAIDASTSEALDEKFRQAATGSSLNLIVDLSDILYISSSGWGVIVKFMQLLSGSGRGLALSGMNEPVFKIFRDLGFEPLIPHYLSVEAALEDLTSAEVGLEELGAVEVPAQLEEVPDVDENSPILERAGVEPLKIIDPEKIESLDITLDLENRSDNSNTSDEKIRKIGWDEYGNRLISKSDKKNNRGKK
jgi:anti-anti-sigma factor